MSNPLSYPKVKIGITMLVFALIYSGLLAMIRKFEPPWLDLGFLGFLIPFFLALGIGIVSLSFMFPKLAEVEQAAKLQVALEEQKRLRNIKADFLNVVSHELRTPITPMKGQLQMILRGYFGELTGEQKKCLEMVLRNTKALDELISDVVDISRFQAGTMKLSFQNSDLLKTVGNAVETMQAEAKRKKVSITLKKEKLPLMTYDRQRIRQVVLNLLGNAIEFSPGPSKISVTVALEGSSALVSVSDTGLGIAPENHKRIFLPFEQVEGDAYHHHEGTGLGLAICRGIIFQHGGKIGVESSPGKGSRFWFTLPLKSRHSVKEKRVELFTPRT